MGEFSAGVLDGDLVAEESRGTGAGMGDQCLVLGQFQSEVIAQELPEAGLDVFGLGLGPGEPQQGVIGLCRGPGYAEAVGVVPGQGGAGVFDVGIILRVRW